MSQENVEIVRRFVNSDLDEGWADADPDIVWNPLEEPEVHGPDAARASLARWASTWDEYEVIFEEFIDVGDRVLVAIRMRGRGRETGIDVEGRPYDVYTLRGGLIVRMDEYAERSEALAAVGLQE
jgi:ketosteroid isomerase-like protein